MRGQRFGRLTVKSENPFVAGNHNHLYVEVRCDCGKEKRVGFNDMRAKRIISCGCFRAERLTAQTARTLRHGHSRRGAMSTTYRVWADMLKRCRNSRHWAWKYYGGRGIGACERWLVFDNFLKDMGERPKLLTLDRINNDGHYEPGNCRWATRKQQSENRRKPGTIPLPEGGR